jgi:glutamate-ammonia-ligase adenylyltransferase
MPEPIRKISDSRAASALLAAHPEWAAELTSSTPFTRAEMTAALAGSEADDEAALKRRLRHLRSRVLLRTMARDLDGAATLEEVCGAMSDLAEVSIAATLAHVKCEDLVVVGMGKLGGRELNVSSDIDLVFLYQGTPEDGPRFERAGQRLIAILSERTEDGFVFRVDMRLRPYGSSGPLASSFDALDQYFVTQGREWERYAWIKARAMTGNRDDELAKIVRPFVYRKYLDYATLGAMRALHGEVRRDVARRELANDVKLGPGGIREVEFVAQALQLIRGGRDLELRKLPTLEVLPLLSAKNLLPDAAARELSDAYRFLRNVEHRLQYLDDAQRHDLPENTDDQVAVARMTGFGDWLSFEKEFNRQRGAVTRHFEAVFAEREQKSEPWPEHPRLAALRASQRYAALPDASRRRLDALIPALARAAQATPDAEATLVRGVDLVEAIASRAAYLALLAENPQALERVARIISASSWAAEFVTRHPLLLDELLDDRVLYAPFDLEAFARGLARQLDDAQGDTERQMNVLREAHQAQVFRLLAQDLAGVLTVERLADHLSALADEVLEETIRRAWRDLRVRHRESAPRFAVIGYGKLGGKELGYASDLDIIFLFDDADERAGEVYARLGQRINHWLSSRTSSGVLFETDLALRPSGASGLLVSAVDAFQRYQEESAWTWEHQALTRARFSAGDRAVGEQFEGIRTTILRRPRGESLRKEILQMRDKMLAAHPNRSGLFDLKHDRGGMIDIEFAVQCLVLGFSHRHPDLTGNLGNIALLRMAAAHGLIDADLAERCREAYREFRRLQHSLRLNGARYARVPTEQVAPHVDAVSRLWRSVIGAGP